MSENRPNEESCTCPGGPNDEFDGEVEVCIQGTVYGYCESEFCGGGCDDKGACYCPMHTSGTHDSGYGGTFHE